MNFYNKALLGFCELFKSRGKIQDIYITANIVCFITTLAILGVIFLVSESIGAESYVKFLEWIFLLTYFILLLVITPQMRRIYAGNGSLDSGRVFRKIFASIYLLFSIVIFFFSLMVLSV